jgi:hypothetical protein
MLGRLFNSASSTAATSPSGTRPSTSHALESDEIHTRNLLYPDTSSVASSFHSQYSFAMSHSSSSTNGARFGDMVDLDASRDVRIVIAQDAIVSENKAIVYDSKASSMSSTEECPTSPTLAGGLGRTRRRNPHSSSQHTSGFVNTDDELRVLTDCMFGSAPLSYKGPSNKVHILPTVEDRRPSNICSPLSSRRGSLRNGSGLAASLPSSAPAPVKEKRTSVLITRLFSVAIPSCPPLTASSVPSVDGTRNIPQGTRSGENSATPMSSVGSTSGFPFPKMVGNSPVTPSISKLVKPTKTAMYAVGLIISIPPTNSSCLSVGTHCCYHKPILAYDSDLAHRHEHCCPTPPSFDDDYSTLPSSGSRTDPVCDDFRPASLATDGRMDLITKHWDVITRALSDLQQVLYVRILENLAAARLASPQNLPQNGIKYMYNKVELRPMALLRDETVRSQVDFVRWRVVSGIKVPRVVVGQGRWDLWQGEAKWANDRYGGRDMNLSVDPFLISATQQNPGPIRIVCYKHFHHAMLVFDLILLTLLSISFFLTLLTAFLGHHTDWLDVLGPEAYKRRHIRHMKAQCNPEDAAIPTRTVLLCADRIAARRLIYLLSAFLPAKPYRTLDALPPTSRPSSLNCLSQSPPGFGDSASMESKIGSLKRKARKRPSKLNMAETIETNGGQKIADGLEGWTIPVTPVASSVPGSALQLPLAASSMRKTESTGILMTLPSAATYVGNTTAASPKKIAIRPGSSGSVASLNLKCNLKRTGTTNTSMDSSAWGSFLSFWSNPKSRSSTATSEASLHEEMFPTLRPTPKTSCGLEDYDMVDVSEMSLDEDRSPNSQTPLPFSPTKPSYLVDQISVDEMDGAINVPLDLSFASPISSPPSVSWPMPSIDSGLGRPFNLPVMPLPPPPINAAENDSPCNVVGWVDEERFHPDFVLQAVKPYPEVETDIKHSMRMEPAPVMAGIMPWSEIDQTKPLNNDRWTTISEVLVADTKRLQIKRFRLRRRVKVVSTPSQQHQYHFQNHLQPILNLVGQTETEEDEVLDEEIVCDVDDTLATAIEQVIGAVPVNGSVTESSAGSGCKGAVLGALERVVGDVVKGAEGERWGGNVLTEGVGRWICGVEAAH